MTIIIILYAIITLLSILHIIRYGSRPAKSLSWVLILLLFPFGGTILYVVFGINRRRFKFFKLKQTIRRRLYDVAFESDDIQEKELQLHDRKSEKLVTLIRNSTRFGAYSGNKITLLKNGKDAFEAIFNAMEKAEKFIHLEYYLFEEGKLLDQCYTLFEKKRAEGLEVRVLYDAIGSYFLKKSIIRKFKKIGVKIYPIMPLRFGSFLFTLNYRNHRKIIIIDGTIGFTGGINISDKYIKPVSELGVWDDSHLCIKGPAIDSLHRIFIKDYYFASNKEILLKDKYLPEIPKQGDHTVQIVESGPDSKHPAVMQQYITMINLAEHYIYISNPYFIPNSALLEALRIASLSNVKIKLLVPKKSDSWLAKYSMFSFFEELLFVGIEIYEYKNTFLHSKLIVMDGEIASIGSGNFDHRSFEHNFEANALIYDQKIAKNICKNFIQDCRNSELLTYETYKKRPIKRKLSEGIARFFSPLL